MDKVIVAYWSQTGNTAAMAAAIGEGITEAGKEAVVTDISSVSMDDLQAASAFALGCPAMGAEVLEEGEMEPFVTEVEAFASGKKMSVRFLRLGRRSVDERLGRQNESCWRYGCRRRGCYLPGNSG